MKQCSLKNCPGQYEKKYIPRLLKYRGKLIVLENVPAEVCSVCGDVLISLETAEAMELILKNPGMPSKTAPVYGFMETAGALA